MLYEQLIKIGLNSTEVDLYIEVFQSRRITPAMLSKKTGIKRSTVYAAAAELVRKGLISEDDTKKVRYFVAKESFELHNFINEDKAALAEKEKNIRSIISQLDVLPKSEILNTPKIKFIESGDIIDFLYKRLPIWVSSMNDIGETTWWGFQDKSFVKNKKYRDWIEFHWLNSQGTDLKLFTNQSNVEEKIAENKKYQKRQVKFWSGEKFSATQWVVGEYVINLVTDKKQDYLIEIKDRVLSDNLRNLFKKLF